MQICIYLYNSIHKIGFVYTVSLYTYMYIPVCTYVKLQYLYVSKFSYKVQSYPHACILVYTKDIKET